MSFNANRHKQGLPIHGLASSTKLLSLRYESSESTGRTRRDHTCWQFKVGVVLQELLSDGCKSLSLRLLLASQQQALSFELSPLLCLLLFPPLLVLFPLLGLLLSPLCSFLLLQRHILDFSKSCLRSMTELYAQPYKQTFESCSASRCRSSSGHDLVRKIHCIVTAFTRSPQDQRSSPTYQL